MYHQGTLEEMVGREFSHSLSAKHDYPSFDLMIDDYEYLIKLSKNRGGLFVSECFNFSVEDEEGFIPIILKHKMGLGIDFRVINGFGNRECLPDLNRKAVAFLHQCKVGALYLKAPTYLACLNNYR